MLSGAALLYFQGGDVYLTLKPSISTFMTGIDPFDFMRFVEVKAPQWLPKFSEFVRLWNFYTSSLARTSKLLEPLHNVVFKTVLLSYPRGSSGWEESEALLESSNLERGQVQKVIDPFSAADELFSHLFLERYLELYEAHRGPDELFAMGARASQDAVQPVKVDWKLLFEYCDERFGSNALENMLTTAYMFRMCVYKSGAMDLMLSNPALIQFLASLPVESSRTPNGESQDSKDLDVVAWEFFRQVVSPQVDPLNTATVEKIGQLIHHRPDEIRALKRKCLKLAQDFGQETKLENLEHKIAQHIRVNIEADVQALLSLDERALRELLDLVFSDEKTWMAISAFIYSLLNGGSVLTAGAAIFALSSLGSKAVKAAAAKRDKLEVSDYALLYRLRQ